MSNLKVYCQSCGFAHGYTLHKPNFCQSCGTSLGSVEKNSPRAPSSPAAEDEPESLVFLDNLEGLEFDHQDYSQGPQTLGSIMQQYSSSRPPSTNSDVSSRKPRNTLSKEEVLEQLKKEGSAIRPKTS